MIDVPNQSIVKLRFISAALEAYNLLILKQESCRIELDKTDGQQAFRAYVATLELLIEETGAVKTSRAHRSEYASAYRVLYEEGALGYIPQIYDSAQESFPLIFVNGQRFDFSAEVLVLGQRLVEAHFRLVHELRVADLKGQICKESVKAALEQLDSCWIAYEQKYIGELIYIEGHAKAIIRGFIEAEKKLGDCQIEQKLQGKIFLSGAEYEEQRKNLCEAISRLNSVANIEGKGRDDLGIEVLLAAEQVLGSVTEEQARSVRILAQKIRSSWEGVRQVLRFFGENFQMVDPQLRNNPELVAILREYESSWEKGKRYFLQKQKQSQILACSAIVQAAKQKYSKFRELLDDSDPKIFWTIPSLIVLRSLEDQDEGLTEGILLEQPSLNKKQLYLTLKSSYADKKREGCGNFSLYNCLQQLLIGEEQAPQELLSIVNQIKQLALSMQRVCPTDWNDMLGVLLLTTDE